MMKGQILRRYHNHTKLNA